MKRFFILGSVTLASAALAAATVIPPEVASCTNFTVCAKDVRAKAVAAVTSAGKEGDVATIAKILGLAAKDGVVTSDTYAIWSAAARQFADLASASRKRGAPKELLAGFREGGSTFGLWSDDSGPRKTGDRKVVEAIGAVLYVKMPQTGLTPALVRRRDLEYLDLMVKVGTESDRLAAYAKVESAALACAKPATTAETNAVLELYKRCLKFHADRKLWKDYAACAEKFAAKTVLSGEWSDECFRARAKAAYCTLGDESVFGPYLAAAAKRPISSANLQTVKAFMNTLFGGNGWGWQHPGHWKRLEPLFASYWQAGELAGFSENDRAFVVLARLAKALAERDYAAAKPAYGGFTAFSAAAQQAARWAVFGWPFGERGRLAEVASEAGAYADAAALLEPGWPRLMACYRAGDRAGVYESAARIATNGNVTANDRFRAGAILASLEAKDPRDFSSRLAQLRGKMEEAAYFSALRESARDFFLLDPTAAGVERVKTVIALSDALKRPEEKLVYDLVYLEKAPQSAGEALATDVFSKLKTENRLGRYAVYDTFEKSKELKVLKSADAPHLAADVEGREACVAACYDASGLHIYLRFNDPEAWKVRDGLAAGPNLEYEIQPGGETTGHWQMLSAAEPGTDAGVEWDSPRKGYKLGPDYIRTDATSTDTTHVFHTFVPWILCWNEFPKEGDVWRYGLVAGWAGQFGALGGGAVHELGRAMLLRFRLAPAVRERMKLSLVRQAAADYRKVRGKFENAEFWCDPHLGDKAFYEKVVEPLLAELDAKAALVTVEKPAAKDIEAVFRDLFRFADFRLALDAEREKWVTASMFSEK